MMPRSYPIVIGHKYKKGLVGVPMGGAFDLWVVRLVRDYETGETFDMEDITQVQAILRFTDRGSVQMMANVCAKAARDWRDRQ